MAACEPLLAAECGEALEVLPRPWRRPLGQRLALAVCAGLLVAGAAVVGQASSAAPAAVAAAAPAALVVRGPTPVGLQLADLVGHSDLQLPLFDHILAKIGSPCGRLIPAPAGFSELPAGAFGVSLSGGVFLLLEAVLLLVLQMYPKLTSDFVSRKVWHAGSGLLFMTLDPASAAARGATYLIGVTSILMTWEIFKDIGIRPFRFGKAGDAGITIYLIIVMLWFFGQLPPRALAPMFFGDPAGAIVGKFFSKNFHSLNKVWYNNKTRFGSLAVFLVTWLALWLFYPPLGKLKLLLLSAAATLAEALAGELDHLCLALVVISGYYLMEGHD